MWLKVCDALSNFWPALWCLFFRKDPGACPNLSKTQAKYVVKKDPFVNVKPAKCHSPHCFIKQDTDTGCWFYGKIFYSRLLTNPKPVYSSCLVPHHSPQFEPVCTGIKLTGTHCTVITNLAPLHSPFFFLFLYLTHTGCIYEKKTNI